MPQMAPLNWIMMFIFITIMLTLLNSMNYFLFLYKPSKKISKNKLMINWKW